MLNKKVKLPPISGLVNELPPNSAEEKASPDDLMKLDIPSSPRSCSAQMSPTSSQSEDGADSGRSAPYTLHDDLSIFKVVASYYGIGFRGKIPWSFWQTYKRATGSTRSNSSLYHHWNGAMKKKYDVFISTGRLSDVILWLETALMAEQGQHQPQFSQHNNEIQPSGKPLCHNRSQPSVPICVGQNCHTQNQPLSLIRTASCLNETELPFLQFF